MKRRIGRVALVAALVGAAGGGVGAGTAAADYEIHVRGNGTIARIGDLRNPAEVALPGARRVFGTPAIGRRTRVTCPASWRGIGLTITFVDLGGGDPCTREGNVQHARVTARRWSTSRGLRVGDPAARLRRLYPTARKLYGQMALVTRPQPLGPPGSLSVKLGAFMRDGRVAALEIWVGGAGE